MHIHRVLLLTSQDIVRENRCSTLELLRLSREYKRQRAERGNFQTFRVELLTQFYAVDSSSSPPASLITPTTSRLMCVRACLPEIEHLILQREFRPESKSLSSIEAQTAIDGTESSFECESSDNDVPDPKRQRQGKYITSRAMCHEKSI
jgi:hypothetical protein